MNAQTGFTPALSKFIALSCVLLLPSVFIPAQADDPADVRADAQRSVIELLTAEHDVNSKTVRVAYDPLYGTPKNYEGYDLAELLLAFGVELATGANAKDIRLIAADDYVVILTPEQILAHRPLLAFEDLNAPYGKPWAPVSFKGRPVDPGPFYLVWPGLDDVKSVPWPYSVVKMDLVQKSIYAAIAPPADHEAYAGFELFTEQCSRCHSINLVGGTLGPELNSPVSVLEYFNTAQLPAYIRDSASFRARSQMPDFKHLSDAQIGSIIGYLGYIKDYK